MKLSILICTIYSRWASFEALARFIYEQIPDKSIAEICFMRDHGGPRTMSIGRKRQLLLENSTGDYVCFVDDDDLVASSYVKLILEAIKPKPCCVGFQGLLVRQGYPDTMFVHSLQCGRWYEENEVYFRTPNHLNPVKRELALKVGFIDASHGEDKRYSDRLYPLLKNEVMINHPLYFYFPGASR